MTGANLGSASEQLFFAKWLAIQINQQCNMHCPYCYLGAKVGDAVINDELIEKIIALQPSGVVVVATEPLYDERSVDVVSVLAKEVRTRIITNGKNLFQFAGRILDIEAVDISLDGGPKTYCREASFDDVAQGALKFKEISGKDVYALHTLTVENLAHIGDMLKGSRGIGATKSYFAPVIRTVGGGENQPVPTEKLVEHLKPFVGQSKWTLVIDPIHAILNWEGWGEMKRLVGQLPEDHRIIFDSDPGDWIRRIDVNGETFHPVFALHPRISFPGQKL